MSEEDIKKEALKYVSEKYGGQNRLHKDTERTFENYMRCRSFRDFVEGLKRGLEISKNINNGT